MAQQQNKETANGNGKPFLTDVKTLRARAREHLDDGALGSNYIGDPQKTIAILQSVLATEIVCVLRYTVHAITASGISSDSVKAEFAEHAKDEQGHMMLVAERIAVDHYRELIRYFGNDDPGTKSMLQEILRKEEEHADDMHDLLVAHEGSPMLKG